MAIVIHGAAVVTVDADGGVIYDGAVAIEADRLAAVGPSRDILARYPRARTHRRLRQGRDAPTCTRTCT
jgi:5-methylthioadenosine/S-adenosylhomocysteine deaminase